MKTIQIQSEDLGLLTFTIYKGAEGNTFLRVETQDDWRTVVCLAPSSVVPFKHAVRSLYLSTRADFCDAILGDSEWLPYQEGEYNLISAVISDPEVKRQCQDLGVYLSLTEDTCELMEQAQ